MQQEQQKRRQLQYQKHEILVEVQPEVWPERVRRITCAVLLLLLPLKKLVAGG